MLKELLSFVTELRSILRDLKDAYISVFKTNPLQANISLSLIVVLILSGNLFYFEVSKKEIQIIYFDKCPKGDSKNK